MGGGEHFPYPKGKFLKSFHKNLPDPLPFVNTIVIIITKQRNLLLFLPISKVFGHQWEVGGTIMSRTGKETQPMHLLVLVL